MMTYQVVAVQKDGINVAQCLFNFSCIVCLLLAGVGRASAESRRRRSDLLVLARSVAHDSQVDSRRYRVVALVVDLGQSERSAGLRVDRGLAEISHGSRVDHVTDDVLFDGLILRDSGGAGLASHKLDVASALLVASVVSSLLGHLEVFL